MSLKYLLDRLKRENPGITKEELYRLAKEELGNKHYSDQEWEAVTDDLCNRIFTVRS
jgi:hypothetical protein